jgi:hypothetical protein
MIVDCALPAERFFVDASVMMLDGAPYHDKRTLENKSSTVGRISAA